MNFKFLLFFGVLSVIIVAIYINLVDKSKVENKYLNHYKWDGKSVECIKCKEDIELVNVINKKQNFKIYVRKENDLISDVIRKSGDWTDCKTIINLWESLPGLKDGDYYMDAGANIGICSFDMLNNGIKTISIEPIPNNLHLLTKSLLYNSKWKNNITLFKVGLSNKEDIMYINIIKGNWGGSSLINLNQNYYKKKVTIAKLDTLLNSFNNIIHLASVDIQGYELYMLEGSIKLLQNKIIRHFLMEIWCEALERINVTETNIYELFERYSYRIKEKTKCRPNLSFDIIASSM